MGKFKFQLLHIVTECSNCLINKVCYFQTFATPFAPMQTLVDVLSPDSKTVDRKTLDAHIADFDLHIDQIFQAGGFATACTSNVKSKLMTFIVVLESI